MITFSKLGKKGNIGNQLFQIASTIGIANSNNLDFGFPDWKFSNYFEHKLPSINDEEFIHYNEKQYHFEPIKFDNKNYDLEGWFQSEKYFYDNEIIKHYFKFNEEYVSDVKQKFLELFKKRTILISIRRGDFVDHQDYFQLPINFYLNALANHFPNWKNCNILILSDDIKYCKFHFSSLANVFFADSVDVVQQLILSSLCDDFIISNSTFSWWCAWFGEKKDSKVIRPLHNFSVEKRKNSDDKDYFPDRWIAYDFSNKKIDLKNTVIILKKPDVILENYFKLNFNFLNQNDIYNYNEISNAETKYIFINDTIPSPVVLFQSSNLAKSTIFYTKGKFLKISRILDLNTFTRQFDFGIFSRLLGKNQSFNRNNLCMIYFYNLNIKNSKILEEFKNNSFKNFDVIYCFSGKLIPFFEFKFYIITTFDKWKRSIKKEIKKQINYKKK